MRYEPGKKKILEQYKVLRNYPPLTVKIPQWNEDHLLRFALYICDPESELMEIKDEEQRLEKAAQKAGLDTRLKKVQNMLQLDGSFRELDEMIDCLFLLFNNHRYQLWFVTRQAYRHIYRALIKKPDESKTKDLMAETSNRVKVLGELEVLAEKIAKQEQLLFKDEHIQSAVERVAASKMLNYPEMFAQKDTVI